MSRSPARQEVQYEPVMLFSVFVLFFFVFGYERGIVVGHSF